MLSLPRMKISEYIIRPDLPVPLDVVDKIQLYHAHPMSFVREELGTWIAVSKNSGYRPEQHELWKKRELTSEHLFKPIDQPGSEKGLGAADYRTEPHRMEEMFNYAFQITAYTRFTFYPNVDTPFIHMDYRFPDRGKRLFISRSGQWKQVDRNVMLKTIQRSCQNKR